MHFSLAHTALAELEGSATRLGSEDLVHLFDPDELLAHLDHVNSPWVAQKPVVSAGVPLPGGGGATVVQMDMFCKCSSRANGNFWLTAKTRPAGRDVDGDDR